MKALSLHQPFASLIVEGAKRHETRSWAPPRAFYGERIAIHAAKRRVTLADAANLQINLEWAQMLPLGAVVAMAVLVDAVEIVVVDYTESEPQAICRHHDGSEEAITIERFGWYASGRWIWRLSDIEPLDPPVLARGYQGFWEWHRWPQHSILASSDDRAAG